MPTLPPGSSAPGRGWFCIPVTLRPRAWPVSFHGSQGDSAPSPGRGHSLPTSLKSAGQWPQLHLQGLAPAPWT